MYKKAAFPQGYKTLALNVGGKVRMLNALTVAIE